MSNGYSQAVSRIIASQQQRYVYPSEFCGSAPVPFVHQHFTVANEARALQAPAWSDYVGRILDVPINRSQVESGFRGEIDSYVLSDMIYLDCRTDPFAQVRTASRISTDGVRNYVFHVAVEGIIETATGPGRQRKSAQFVPGILALDLNQTMHMVRPTYARVLAFFLPRAMVEAEIPDAESIHGRVIGYTSPLTRLILDHLQMLCRRLPALSPAEIETTIRVCAQLIIAAFAKQARLGEKTRAAAHAAVRNEVQGYINVNLHQRKLSPESVLGLFRLPRASLYRMFEHEGGLGAYIRNCRLRAAADELVEFPKMAIMEIAYGLCFSSASDFTRAFRRSYGMSPQDFRALALDMLLPD
ncbi:helix-turn-helix domain-containing protein [Oxalobacteraceae bacterium CAVE-383]|nr:helix-turn-helix domain-containing protein [Oxalobacteraceae bacterium CAVE-383]